MKTQFLLIYVLLLNISICTGQNQTPFAPYISFINDQKQSAKEYILDLFKTHDIVVVCERAHSEITQYDLFLDIIRDKRFINNVGNVFTEIGVSNLNPALNIFLQTKNLSLQEQQRQILGFHRDLDYSFMWEKYNYTYLMQNLYILNNRLTQKKSINLYPSNIPLDWKEADSTNYESTVRPLLKNRDSIIAAQIMNQLDKLKSTSARHKKALVIMNYRHAFNRNCYTPDGKQISNVTAFLFKWYGNKVANVLLNQLGYSQNDTRPLLQEGKWDAAFAFAGDKTIGFNLMNTPFGKDSFDLWVYKTGLTYQDVFTGYVFYLPIETHKLVSGVPGFLDSDNFDEFFRRLNLSSLILPNQKRFTHEEILSFKNNLQDAKKNFNQKREEQYRNINYLIGVRNQWLR